MRDHKITFAIALLWKELIESFFGDERIIVELQKPENIKFNLISSIIADGVNKLVNGEISCFDGVDSLFATPIIEFAAMYGSVNCFKRLYLMADFNGEYLQKLFVSCLLGKNLEIIRTVYREIEKGENLFSIDENLLMPFWRFFLDDLLHGMEVIDFLHRSNCAIPVNLAQILLHGTSGSVALLTISAGLFNPDKEKRKNRYIANCLIALLLLSTFAISLI